MSRNVEYSSIENKYVSIKTKYDSMKDDINNNIIVKIATAYEESAICLQDQAVVRKIKNNIKFEKLINRISNAEKASDINNYKNITSSLNLLNIKVNKLISELDELQNSISKASMAAYTKLSDSYNNEKNRYSECCSTIDGFFKNYDTSSSKYNCTKALINNMLPSDPEYQGLCRERDNAYIDMQKCLAKIVANVFKLNALKVNLQNLMENGLEKTNQLNVNGFNHSVVFPNGRTTTSY